MNKENMSEENDRRERVCEGFSTATLFGQVGGILPYSYELKSGKGVHRFRLAYFVSFVFIQLLYWGSMVVVSLNYKLKIPQTMMELLWKMGDFGRVYNTSTGFMCNIYLSMKHTPTYAKVLEGFYRTDMIFYHLGVKVDYARLKRKHYIQMVFHQMILTVTTLAQLYLINRIEQSNEEMVKLVVICVPGAVVLMILLLFKSLVDIIAHYFEALNETIKKISESRILYSANGSMLKKGDGILSSKRNADKKCTKELLDRISLIWHVYESLCDVLRCIENIFSGRILTSFLGIFLSMIFNTFFGINKAVAIARGQNTVEDYYTLLFAMQQFLFYLILCMIPIHVGQTITSVCNKTSALINQMMIHEHKEDIATKLHQMSTHMLQRRPSFTGLGLFVVDNTLLFTVVGGITTYMVILLQFSALKLHASPAKIYVNITGV